MRGLLAICIGFGFSVAAQGLRKGDDLLLLVQSSCWSQVSDRLQVKALRAHGLSLQHKSFPPGLKRVAISARAEQDLNTDALKSLAGQDCILRAEPNSQFQITGAADPLASSQVAWPAIHDEGAELFFYHPMFGLRESVVIAIVDTGVQTDHPDLISRLWHSPKTGELGYDFVHGQSSPTDDNGHGTHVAGLVGAQRNNGVGGRGVMGDFSQLMAVKTQGSDGGGSLADLINGIRYAVDQGAEVINLSVAGSMPSPALKEVIVYALNHSVTLVAAAGNDGLEITPTQMVTPVGYSIAYPGLIGVGATDALTILKPSYSNFGPNYVQISAPGSANGAGLLSTFLKSTYQTLAGTSQSAPMVSGAAALTLGFLKSQGLNSTPAEVAAWIEQAATEDTSLVSYFQNGRRLDLERLGRLLMNSTVIDATGGFDDSP